MTSARTMPARERLGFAALGLLVLAVSSGCEQVLGIEDLEHAGPPNNGSLWLLPPRDAGYDGIDVRVRPLSDPQSAPYGLLNALQFELVGPPDEGFALDSYGYVGLHSDPDGKRVEFVIWGARAAGPWTEQACDGSVLPCARTFQNEDGFRGAQVMIAYDWRAHRDYTLHVARALQDPAGDWWEATLTDQSTGQQTRVGRIQAQLTWQGVTPTTTTWFEFYGEHGDECEGHADPMATFGAPSADGIRAKWQIGLFALCKLPTQSFD